MNARSLEAWHLPSDCGLWFLHSNILEWNSSAQLELCLVVSSNFLLEVLANLSVTSSGTAILDAIGVAVSYFVS